MFDARVSGWKFAKMPTHCWDREHSKCRKERFVWICGGNFTKFDSNGTLTPNIPWLSLSLFISSLIYKVNATLKDGFCYRNPSVVCERVVKEAERKMEREREKKKRCHEHFLWATRRGSWKIKGFYAQFWIIIIQTCSTISGACNICAYRHRLLCTFACDAGMAKGRQTENYSLSWVELWS